MSPGWRWVGRTTVLGFVLYAAAIFSTSPITFDVDDENRGPRINILSGAGITLMILTLLAATAGLFVRLHRARGETRRQLLWIAASATLLAGSFAWLLLVLVLQLDESRQKGPYLLILFLSYLSLPVCTAVAVLRHRLFEIDLIVNRALVLFLATVLVASAYVLLVVALGAQVNGRTGFWPSLLATALVAIAFQPLRRGVVRVADRLAFGAAAEPYEALADFSRQLGESPDPADLLPAVAEAAAGAVGARRVTVELALPFGEVLSARAGAQPGSGPTADIDVIDNGERLGTLTVEMPPGRAVRARDEALLRDLADQALIAFRNAGLSAELEHRVGELDAQARALEDSRRRLISAGDAERRRLEAAVSRDVVPYLEPMPALMHGFAGRRPGLVSVADVQVLRSDVEAALEALREITRGVYPAQLGRAGLEPALRSLIARTPDAQLVVDAGLPRSDSRVEAAAYFCVAEALRALVGAIEVSVKQRADEVVVEVTGDPDGNLPLAHMRDRAEALDGTVTSRRSAGRLSLEVRLPTAQPAMA